MSALDTDALALDGIDQAMVGAERAAALAGVVGLFVGSEAELIDVVAEGGLERLAERVELAVAGCAAVVERGSTGTVHVSWSVPCTLPTGVVAEGDVVVVPSGDAGVDALSVHLSVKADAFPLTGVVSLTPSFFPIAFLQDVVVTSRSDSLATTLVFGNNSRIAAGEDGVMTVDLPFVMLAQSFSPTIGAVGERVCAASSRRITFEGVARRGDACDVSARQIDISVDLVCAKRVDEATGRGEVAVRLDAVAPGPLHGVVSETVDSTIERGIDLEGPALGCR